MYNGSETGIECRQPSLGEEIMTILPWTMLYMIFTIFFFLFLLIHEETVSTWLYFSPQDVRQLIKITYEVVLIRCSTAVIMHRDWNKFGKSTFDLIFHVNHWGKSKEEHKAETEVEVVNECYLRNISQENTLHKSIP